MIIIPVLVGLAVPFVLLYFVSCRLLSEQLAELEGR